MVIVEEGEAEVALADAIVEMVGVVVEAMGVLVVVLVDVV